MSTPRAGKNMAEPVANCAATGGTPTSAPDDIGYTTPNSYAQVNINVTARNIAILFTMHSFLDRGVPSLARRLVRDMCVTRLVDRTPPTSSVVLSRIASLYAMSLLFGVLVMVPAFAVYASAAGVSAVGVACMALSIVLALLAAAVSVAAYRGAVKRGLRA